jgi:hypothetical protein
MSLRPCSSSYPDTNKLSNSIKTARSRIARFGPTALTEVIDADIQTLEEDYVTVVLDPVVHLTFNPDTKRNATSAINQTVGLAGTLQTNIMKPIIGSVARAGPYLQETLY